MAFLAPLAAEAGEWIVALGEMGEMAEVEAEATAEELEPLIGEVEESKPVAQATVGQQIIGGIGAIGGIALQAGLQYAAEKAGEKWDQKHAEVIQAKKKRDTPDAPRKGKRPRTDSDEFAGKGASKKLDFDNNTHMPGRRNPATMASFSKRGTRSGRFTLSSLKGTDATEGEEVPVIPAPKRISKGVPDYHTAKLTYFDRILMPWTHATNPIVDHVFRLNSIFDPDLTGAGHQPYGRDHFAGIYKYYRVLAADVQIRFINYNTTGETTSRWVICGYELTDDTADVYNDWQTFVEGKHSKAQILAPNASEYNGVGGKAAVMNYHYEPQKWDYHVMETGTEERWTPIGTNPTNQHYIVLHAGSAGNATDGAILAYVHISYTVQFREITDAKQRTGS